MTDDTEILIIDDDRVSLKTVERLLSRDGYQVRCAEDGAQGLQMARQFEPDLILLDVIMPGLDGFMVCQALREDPALAEVPIVMLTSLEDKTSRLRGLEAGADDFVSKPFVPEELRARVRTITRLNRYRRLRTERARFGWVVEQAADGYLVVGHEGGLRYANERARCLTGWSEGAAVQDFMATLRQQFALHPEADWNAFPNLPSETPLYLYRAESQHAPPIWLEVQLLQQSTGSQREVLLRLHDVTEKRSSQRSVWSFESVVAHKVRTPLTKATLGLTFLRKKAARLSPAQITEFAEQAYGGIQELRLELDRVLSYVNCPRAIPDNGGYEIAQLPALLQQVSQGMEIALPRYVTQGTLPASLYIDPRAFELVLWEVLDNCKKFHGSGSPRIEITAIADGEWVVLQVQDDGRRLTPHQLEAAFQPYFQGEKTFSGQVPGMGLGLSTLRSLLWEVGGDCTLANRSDGEGVVLRLRFRRQA